MMFLSHRESALEQLCDVRALALLSGESINKPTHQLDINCSHGLINPALIF